MTEKEKLDELLIACGMEHQVCYDCGKDRGMNVFDLCIGCHRVVCIYCLLTAHMPDDPVNENYKCYPVRMFIQ